MAAIWLFVALGYLLLYVFAAVQDHHVPAAASAERSLLLFDSDYYYAMNPLQLQLQDQNWQGSSLPASCIASVAAAAADGNPHHHEVPVLAALDDASSYSSLSHVW